MGKEIACRALSMVLHWTRSGGTHLCQRQLGLSEERYAGKVTVKAAWVTSHVPRHA